MSDNFSNNHIQCGINTILQIEHLEIDFNQSCRFSLFNDQQTLWSVQFYPIGIVDMKTKTILCSGNWTNGEFNNTGKVIFSILLNITILEY